MSEITALLDKSDITCYNDEINNDDQLYRMCNIHVTLNKATRVNAPLAQVSAPVLNIPLPWLQRMPRGFVSRTARGQATPTTPTAVTSRPRRPSKRA